MLTSDAKSVKILLEKNNLANKNHFFSESAPQYLLRNLYRQKFQLKNRQHKK